MPVILATTTPLDVSAVAVSPNYAVDHTVLAGAGYPFLSTDDGSTWSQITNGIVDIAVFAFSPDFAADHTVFSGAANMGVAKSVNGGLNWTWQDDSPIRGAAVHALALSPSFVDDHIAFAGDLGSIFSTGGMFKSTDSGATWITATNDLTFPSVSALALSPGFTSDHTMFAGTQGGGVYRSTDSGGSWTAVNQGLAAAAINAIAASPAYVTDHTAFAGGAGVFKTIDAGQSWHPVNAGLHNLAVTSLAISPSFAADRTIFASTIYGGGIYKSVDGGASWSQSSTGLPHNNVLSLGISPQFAADHTIYAGLQGILRDAHTRGGFVKSTDAGATWVDVSTGPGADAVSPVFIEVSPAYALDNTVFAATFPPSGQDVGGFTGQPTPGKYGGGSGVPMEKSGDTRSLCLPNMPATRRSSQARAVACSGRPMAVRYGQISPLDYQRGTAPSGESTT